MKALRDHPLRMTAMQRSSGGIAVTESCWLGTGCQLAKNLVTLLPAVDLPMPMPGMGRVI